MSNSPRPLAPALLAALLTAAAGPAAHASFISLSPTTSTLAAGASQTITVQLTATETFNLDAVELVFDFDSTRFTTSSIVRGPLLVGNSTITQSFNGISEVFTHNPIFGDLTLTPGQVLVLMSFQLNALPTAPAGPSVLNLDASFNLTGTPTITRINGGALPLSPAPTNGFDPTLDATVTLTPIPEPTALAVLTPALLGLTRRRR